MIRGTLKLMKLLGGLAALGRFVDFVTEDATLARVGLQRRHGSTASGMILPAVGLIAVGAAAGAAAAMLVPEEKLARVRNALADQVRAFKSEGERTASEPLHA